VSGKLRRGLTWLCVICLVMGLLPSSGRAAPTDACFTAVNEQLLELTQETMPFWSEGKLYVSNAVFDEAYRKDLGVFYSHSTDRQSVVLYAGRDALYFFPSTGLCYDNRGKTYPGKAISKGDYIFFPVDVVCQFFGLTYSYTATALAPLLRIKSASVVLSDAVFIDAAGSFMRTRYQTYEKTLADSQPQPQPPQPPAVEDDPVVPVTGLQIALAVCVTEEETALKVLEAFGRRHMQGTFLITAERAEEMPDLVRALVAGGQTVALYAEEKEGEALAAELLRGREALWRAACTATRLVWLPQQEDDGLEDVLTEAGFRQLAFSADYSRYGVDSSARARTILERLTEQEERIALLLGEDSLCGGLEALLRGLQEADHKVVGAR